MRKLMISMMTILCLSFSSCSMGQVVVSFEPDVLYYDNGYNYTVVYVDGILNYRFFDDVMHTFYFRPVPRDRYCFVRPVPRDFHPVMRPRPDMGPRPVSRFNPGGPDRMPQRAVPDRRGFQQPRQPMNNRGSFRPSSTRVTGGQQRGGFSGGHSQGGRR